MARNLDYLVIHFTDTPKNREVSKEDIIQWHIHDNKWSRVGYSDMIHLDGSLENLIPFNQDDLVDPWEISNGARGYNSSSRHIVYVGGMYKGKTTLNEAQEQSLFDYCKYMVLRHPNIKIIGHNQVSNKVCPGFDVYEWLIGSGINKKNLVKGKL